MNFKQRLINVLTLGALPVVIIRMLMVRESYDEISISITASIIVYLIVLVGVATLSYLLGIGCKVWHKH